MHQGEHAVVSAYIAEDRITLSPEEGPPASSAMVEMAFQPPERSHFSKCCTVLCVYLKPKMVYFNVVVKNECLYNQQNMAFEIKIPLDLRL